MAGTIETAKRKLTQAVPNMPGNYNDKVAAFLGVGADRIAGSAPGQAYRIKVSRPGFVDYWEKKLKQAYGL